MRAYYAIKSVKFYGKMEESGVPLEFWNVPPVSVSFFLAADFFFFFAIEICAFEFRPIQYPWDGNRTDSCRLVGPLS